MRSLSITGVALLVLAGCIEDTPSSIDVVGPTISIADFKAVEGDDWEGKLTYLDYSADKRVTIPTKATVSIASQKTVKYSISYPEEPWEDSMAKIKLSRTGRALDGHPVIYRETQPDGSLEIRTSYEGGDNNEPATIRMTYVLSASRFNISKDIRMGGSSEFLNRNVYVFSRP